MIIPFQLSKCGPMVLTYQMVSQMMCSRIQMVQVTVHTASLKHMHIVRIHHYFTTSNSRWLNIYFSRYKHTIKQGGRMWLLHPGLDNQYKEVMFVKHLFYIFKKFKMAPWLLGQLLGKILWQLIKFLVKHAYYCFSYTVSLNLRHKIKSWNVFFKKVGTIWKFTVQY